MFGREFKVKNKFYDVDIDEVVIPINQLKNVKIVNNNAYFKNCIDSWIMDGYKVMGGIIDYIFELGYLIALMDINVCDKSFMCLGKNSDPIWVKLNYKDLLADKESGISVSYDNITKNYLCNNFKMLVMKLLCNYFKI